MNSIIVFCAEYLIAAPAAVLAYVWLKQNKPQKIKLIIALMIAGILALLLARAISRLYYDPRPFVTKNIVPLVPHGADNGFPSEHTTFAVTLSALTYHYRHRLGLLLLGVAVLVGWGRVAAEVHSPIDIVGGFVVGLTAGSLGLLAAHKIIIRLSKPS